ncbi:unnamed protein product, partial [Ectocarpus sp. 12 AP-2014]
GSGCSTNLPLVSSPGPSPSVHQGCDPLRNAECSSNWSPPFAIPDTTETYHILRRPPFVARKVVFWAVLTSVIQHHPHPRASGDVSRPRRLLQAVRGGRERVGQRVVICQYRPITTGLRVLLRNVNGLHQLVPKEVVEMEEGGDEVGAAME